MANRNVKLKNKSGDYLYPYTDNIPTATTSKAGIVKLDSAPTANSNNAITSGAVNTAINTVNTNLSNKLGKTETAAKAVADANGNNIATTYLTKTETAAKATADADGNNIATTYLKKGDEGRGGLNLLVNQLRKAYAWTWSQILSNGQVQIVYSNSGYKLAGPITCNSFYKAGGYSPVIDGKLYSLNTYSGALTQFGTDTNYTAASSNVAIKNGGIYYVGSLNYAKWIDSSGTWTEIGSGFGIKNGALGAFGTQSNTNAAIAWGIIDTGGVWTKIVYSASGYCYAVRDGYVYYATSKGSNGTMIIDQLIQMTTRNDYNFYSANSYNILGIKGNQCDVYRITYIKNGTDTGPYKTFTFNSDIVFANDIYCLLADGSLYKTEYSATLIDTNVLGLGYPYYLKADGVHLVTSKELVIDGIFPTLSGNILFSGAGSEQRSTVYTVGNPATNYSSFKKVTLQEPETITATTSTSITSGGKTYTRDQSRDSVFTQSPDDLKKQTPTKWQLLEMISNVGDQ